MRLAGLFFPIILFAVGFFAFIKFPVQTGNLIEILIFRFVALPDI